MFRTSNPAFRNSAYESPETWDSHEGRLGAVPDEKSAAVEAKPGAMSIQGTCNKSLLLLTICVATALVGWKGYLEWGWSPMAILLGGGLGGFVVALITIFKPRLSPFTAPLYAALEGVFVGGISALYAERFAQPAGEDGGLVLNTELIFNAGLLTFGILGGMLVGYTTRIIRPGPLFRKIWMTATLGVIFYFIIAMLASLFGFFSLASVFSPENGGLVSIGFSLLLVGLASTGLILDFEMVEVGVKNGAPTYMEWYSGFAILVTLVWLYLELLRLLAKLQSRE